MTYREKFWLEKPVESIMDNDELDDRYCPRHFGYEKVSIGDTCDSSCKACWDREIEEGIVVNSDNIENPATYLPPTATRKILDSGNRREFETGAVRDIQEGKGRCDLLPLDVASKCIPYNTHHCAILECINNFQQAGDIDCLYKAIDIFAEFFFKNRCTMLLEVAIHFEEGAKKYGDNNWRKGIPVRCYIDSAVRHYLKFLRGDADEPHDRAFCWNLMCAIWTCKHKPELNDYAVKEKEE